jgi:hypothetical protein
MRQLEELLPPEQREEVRRRALGWRGFYSPWLHLGTTSAVGIAVVAAMALCLREVRPWQWAFAAGVFLLSNIVEWHAHRDMLHKRWRPLGVLYDRHTPMHHMVFVTGDMAIRSPREFRLVLLPAYGIAAILLVTAPPAALFWALGQPNLAALYLLVTTAYVLLYEWLHLAYHLPDRLLWGPLKLVRALRWHHEVHHDPRLMQRWNFNVTVPIWDAVRGTIAQGPAQEPARPLQSGRPD